MSLIKRNHLVILLLLCYISGFSQNENIIKIYPDCSFLYRNCNNELKISVDSISSQKELKFSIEGGTIQSGTKLNEVIVLPVSFKVILSVYNEDQLIGIREFLTRNPPEPTITFFADNKLLIENGIPRETKTITVKAIRDSTFSTVCPKDALFKVSYTLDYVKKGKSLSDSESHTDTVILNPKLMKKADRILFELSNEVKKDNDLNEVIYLGFMTMIKNIQVY